MKRIILFLAVALSVSACRTPEQAAQRHLKRAIKLDPTIVSKLITDTTVKGVANGNVDIKTPESSGEFNFDDQKFKKYVDSMLLIGKNPYEYYDGYNHAIEFKPNVYNHTDSNVVIDVAKDSKGKYFINYKVKPKIVNVPVSVPYEVKVKVPGKTITLEVDKPAYKYIWFWALCALSLLALFLWLKGSKPVLYIQEKIKGAK